MFSISRAIGDLERQYQDYAAELRRRYPNVGLDQALEPTVAALRPSQQLGRRASTGLVLEVKVARAPARWRRGDEAIHPCPPIDERTMASRRDLEGPHAAIARAGFAWCA